MHWHTYRYLAIFLCLTLIVIISNITVYSLLQNTSQNNFVHEEKNVMWKDSVEQPQVARSIQTRSRRQKPFFKKQHHFNCGKALQGDPHELYRAEAAAGAMPPKEYVVWLMLQDCRNLSRAYYWPTEPRSKEEGDFPLAFTIVVNQDTEHVIAMVNTLFAPQNVFYISVDLKADQLIYRNMELFVKCVGEITGVRNIFLSKKSYSIVWGSISQLQPVVDMLTELDASSHPWKYAVTLFNKQFPLKTNREMVRILQLLNGVSDVKVTGYGLTDRFRERNVEDRELDLGIPRTRRVVSATNPLPDITTFKGIVSMSASRQFVHYMASNQSSQRFLDYLRSTSLPDEHFFNTVFASPDFMAPGGYPGRCFDQCKRPFDYFTRYALFIFGEHADNNKQYCTSRLRRNEVCMITTAMLNFMIAKKALVVDKFWSNRGFVARECLRELLFNRTYHGEKYGAPNLDDYRSMDTVKYGLHLKAGLSPNTYNCNC